MVSPELKEYNMAENGWKEYQRLVLTELQRLSKGMERLHEDNTKLNIELAKLKTSFNLKSGIWGGIAGLIPAVTYLVYILVK